MPLVPRQRSPNRAAIAALIVWAAAPGRISAAADGLRLRPSGYLEAATVVRADRGTPRQRPSATAAFALTGEARPEARLFIEARATAGGPPEDTSGFGIVNLHDTFSHVSPALEIEEAYMDFFSGRFDVRAGKQKIAWGKLDTFHPTDIVNPRRFTDPFVAEEVDAKIGVPALRATYFPEKTGAIGIGDGSVQFVWVPLQVPARFPTEAERWFPASAGVPPWFDVPAGALSEGTPAVTIATDMRTENRLPSRELDRGAIGVRAGGSISGVDWSLCYYDGPETMPAFDIAATIVSPRAAALVAGGHEATIGDLRQLHAGVALRPRFGRIRLAGADAAFQFAGFTARLEAAYGSGRLLPRTTEDLFSAGAIARAVQPELNAIIGELLLGRRVPVPLEPLFVARDVVEWGAGVDYPYAGWVPIVQVNQTLILNNPTALLIHDVDTRLFAALRKSLLDNRWGAEIVAVQGFERSYTTAIARLSYAIADRVRVRAGYLFLAGTRHSVIGQYGDHDQAFADVRYTY